MKNILAKIWLIDLKYQCFDFIYRNSKIRSVGKMFDRTRKQTDSKSEKISEKEIMAGAF